MEYLRKKLKRLRVNRGLTKTQMAKELNIPRTTYSNYELGTVVPGIEIIARIAEFYGVRIDYLVFEKGRRIKMPLSIQSREDAKIFLSNLNLDFLHNELEEQQAVELAKLILFAIKNFGK